MTTFESAQNIKAYKRQIIEASEGLAGVLASLSSVLREGDSLRDTDAALLFEYMRELRDTADRIQFLLFSLSREDQEQQK